MRLKQYIRLWVLAMLCAGQAGAVELLVNGNLNSVTDGVPDGWYVYADEIGAWYEIETSFTYDGSPCFVMYPSGEEWPGVELGQTVSFEPNSISVLHFSCVINTDWYSVNNWGDATVELTFREPNGAYLAYDEFVIFADNQYPVPTVWTPYSHDFAVPAGAGQVTLVLRGSDWLKGLYWDNISLSYAGSTYAECLLSSESWNDSMGRPGSMRVWTDAALEGGGRGERRALCVSGNQCRSGGAGIRV